MSNVKDIHFVLCVVFQNLAWALPSLLWLLFARSRKRKKEEELWASHFYEPTGETPGKYHTLNIIKSNLISSSHRCWHAFERATHLNSSLDSQNPEYEVALHSIIIPSMKLVSIVSTATVDCVQLTGVINVRPTHRGQWQFFVSYLCGLRGRWAQINASTGVHIYITVGRRWSRRITVTAHLTREWRLIVLFHTEGERKSQMLKGVGL